MSSKITLGPEEARERLEVHLLPCKIAHDGPAKVDVFFVNKPYRGGNNVDEDEVMATRRGNPDQQASEDAEPAKFRGSAFRGRRLLGQTVALPHGTSGLVVKRDAFATDEEEEEETFGMTQQEEHDGNAHGEEEDLGGMTSSSSWGEGPSPSKARRVWRATGTFSHITYWNHDAIPKPDDAVHKWMDFVEVSRVLHG